jgi:hypothetical protein
LTLADNPGVPAGDMDVERLTVCAVPLTRLTVTVDVVLDPWTMDPLLGLRLTL